jgi:hypothetical protein
MIPDWTTCYEGCLTALYCRNFLENELFLYSEDVPLATQRQEWLQHYGAPPHFGRPVMEFLIEDGRLVGGRWTTSLAHSVSKFNGLNFFMWGCLKSRVLMVVSQKCIEPLLCNDHEMVVYTRAVSGQRLGKHIPIARQQILNNTTVGLQQWKCGVSKWSMLRSYLDNWGYPLSSVWESVKRGLILRQRNSHYQETSSNALRTLAYVL